jgi:adenosylcobinamide amidohydrolase
MSSNEANESLHRSETAAISRFGRFIVAELLVSHRVLSTSSVAGGQTESVRYLVNHQSCEGKAHVARHGVITGNGAEHYHRLACAEINLPPGEVALMGTAANMNYAALRIERFEDVSVVAVVTAGVQGNAARAGDPAAWHEREDGWSKLNPHQGTINTMLLFNCPLTPAAQARAVITMTEAKTVALLELATPSLYSGGLATGTGTDQFCVAAPLDPSRKPKDATSPHVKLGELIGIAVRDATKEALRWQNGLEPSYGRGLFHALGRFGLTEARAHETLPRLLSEADYQLLKDNEKAVFYEPGVAAAAYAFAAVLDRIRYGTLPAGLAHESLRQQAASMAAALSAKPAQWPAYWASLQGAEEDPIDLVLRAIALGWKSKWT